MAERLTDYLCRYSVAETVQLLSEIGFRDCSPFESNGITGGDLLDLEDEELKEDLHLSHLQVNPQPKGLRVQARMIHVSVSFCCRLLCCSWTKRDSGQHTKQWEQV